MKSTVAGIILALPVVLLRELLKTIKNPGIILAMVREITFWL